MICISLFSENLVLPRKVLFKKYKRYLYKDDYEKAS